MTESDPRSRRRGVRASRQKLTRALTAAGFKTQAALAERIADLEGLDAAPKDVVNRVFREQPVDPATLERLARALGTEAYLLYLTADDDETEAGAAKADVGSTAPERSLEAADVSVAPAPVTSVKTPNGWEWRSVAPLVVLCVVLASVIGGGLWYLFARGAGGESVAEETKAAPLEPRFGRFKVAITQFKDDPDGELAVLVRERLERTLGVASAALPAITGNEDRAELAKRFRVDALIDGEVVQVGQLLAVRVYAYVDARGRREQIWAESLPASSRARKLASVADHVTSAVHRLFGLPAGDARAPAHFPLAPVQDEYLRARWFMDQAPSELNLRRASGNFNAALRHDANYAAAHAGLCEVILDAVWIDSEERQLADAEKSCIRAAQLAPEAPEVVRAQAAFLNRSGRAEQAMTMLAKAREREPDDMEIVLALANVEFEMQRRTGEQQWADVSLEHAREATRITPAFWKPYMWLGVYESGIGTLDAAITALQKAYELDPSNEYVTTNLGTMYFCRGDFEAARTLYVKAREMAPASYAGTEFLGLVYYYLKDFSESARLRQTALDMARAGGSAEIHQMWGALADSYRHAGDRQKAIDAYVQALDIVERDFLMGNGTTGDKGARAYYYLTLSQLDPKRPPKAVMASLDRDLDEAYEASSEPTALLRVTQAWLLEKNMEKARRALSKAVKRCPCYGKYPDVEVLAKN
ncbi:tetratricopeptide repeat protein [Peristeroidobacter soli]|uniref:tetratricopeptide repeat protein n=1 Tax=Peristeroidobacter soli TaxID=2497877 RepID=UPI00101B90E1|nr:tetratricopeptide repeat protein [Peristeroidobacter soli]